MTEPAYDEQQTDGAPGENAEARPDPIAEICSIVAFRGCQRSWVSPRRTATSAAVTPMKTGRTAMPTQNTAVAAQAATYQMVLRST
jgi:hypothetical protein